MPYPRLTAGAFDLHEDAPMYEFTQETELLPTTVRQAESRTDTVREIAETVYAREIGRLVVDEICSTLLAERSVGRYNMTVLQALVARDNQSASEIRMRTNSDAKTIEQTLSALHVVGIVEKWDDYGIARYLIANRDMGVDAPSKA